MSAKKRIVALGAVLVGVVGVSVALAPVAFGAPTTVTVGEYTFRYDPDNVAAGATVTDYVGTSTSISIPASVEVDSQVYAVTRIGYAAFSCYQCEPLVSAVIPSTVTAIEGYAFSFNALTSVSLPPSLSLIDQRAFQGNDLTSLTIPGTVTTIGEGAFINNALKSLVIPNSVTAFGENAFRENLLTSVTLGAGISTIPNGAFVFNALTSVTIPGSVVSVGPDAFSFNKLTSVSLPNSVTTVGPYAFSANPLSTVTIPASVTSIGDQAFDNRPYGLDDYTGPLIASVIMKGPVPATIGLAPFGPGGARGPLVTYESAYASTGYTPGVWVAGGESYRTPGTAAPAPGGAEPDPGTEPVPTMTIEPGPASSTAPTPDPGSSARPSPGSDASPSASTDSTVVAAREGGGSSLAPFVVLGIVLGLAAAVAVYFRFGRAPQASLPPDTTP